ncbi:MAG TPA: MarR family winged helix-turn-helix transcriptional regulator [Steroidobacteraceae bacterium]|nr:MarR family winged helix-turn-helix transcriptional regulator [Steroidobacteraceae bacterium]
MAEKNPWLDVDKQGRNLHIGQFLTFIIIRLGNALKSNVTRRYLADFGLSVPEWRLLAMTMRFEPVRFSELVAKSGMDKGQASRTLQMLTKRGWVASRAAARTAGRASARASEGATPVILTVTPKGRKLYRTVLPVAQRNQARLLRLMTREERRVLHGIVKKLFAAIGHSDPLA